MNNPSDSPTAEASFARFFSGELSANPFPLLKQMRSMGALVPVPLPAGQGTKQQAWIVTRWEEAVQVLKDHKRFTVDVSSFGTAIFFRQGAQSLSEAEEEPKNSPQKSISGQMKVHFALGSGFAHIRPKRPDIWR